MMKCSETSVKIRQAKKEDMRQVYKLIKVGIEKKCKLMNFLFKELAEFEKLEDQVRINEEVLIKDGFETNNPAFTCLVAEASDGYIMGYALYFTCYSTWLGKSIFLEDLYVQPAYRQNGIGKQLFMSVAKIAHGLTSKRMDFHVLSWNPASDFYKSLGAVNISKTEKWELFRLNDEALNKMFINQ